MFRRVNKTYATMADLSSQWTIEPLVKCSVANRERLEELETLWISAYADKCLNNSKKYKLSLLQHLLDGRFPDSYLP